MLAVRLKRYNSPHDSHVCWKNITWQFAVITLNAKHMSETTSKQQHTVFSTLRMY